jgi:VanZ family protein
MTLLRITSAILAVYWLGIFVATHLPGSSLPPLGSDKAYHLMAFFGLSVLLNWVMSQKIDNHSTRILVVMSITVGYAIFDEWSQQFVPNRSPDVSDAIADACGAALGVLAFGLFLRLAAPLRFKTATPT